MMIWIILVGILFAFSIVVDIIKVVKRVRATSISKDFFQALMFNLIIALAALILGFSAFFTMEKPYYLAFPCLVILWTTHMRSMTLLLDSFLNRDSNSEDADSIGV
jgi:uncharacterized protein with PQ loop repeat